MLTTSGVASNSSLAETPQFYVIMDDDTNTKVIDFFHVVIAIMCALGLIFNVVNIIVFVKQGLSSSTNIALTAVAVVDVCTQFTTAIGLSLLLPQVEAAAVDTFVPFEIALPFGFARMVFVPIKSWINVFMTAERCLCIVSPLKIKQIISPRRTVIAMVVIYLLILSPAFAEYSEIYYGWKFYPTLNKTLIGLKFRHDTASIDVLVNLMLSIVLLASFPVLISLTSVLIWKLLLVSKWRELSVQKNNNSDQTSLRDRKVIRLVVVVASFQVIALTPSLLQYLLHYSIPEYSFDGRYVQLYILIANIAYVFDFSNSSFNIFIYYTMSSKFKETLRSMFLKPLKRLSVLLA